MESLEDSANIVVVLPGNRLVINDCYVEAGMACLMKYGTDTMQGQFISADGKEVGKDDVSEVVHVQTGEGKKKKVPTRTAAKWSDSLMSCKIRIGAHPRIGVSFCVVCLIAIFSSLYHFTDLAWLHSVCLYVMGTCISKSSTEDFSPCRTSNRMRDRSSIKVRLPDFENPVLCRSKRCLGHK